MAKKIYLTDTSMTTWLGVATDGSNITVECIGGGDQQYNFGSTYYSVG